MSERLVVGPINQGLTTNREPFVIDNDSFPVIVNAYQWRGRIKRKRGTTKLGQLQRYLGTTNGAGNLVVTIVPAPASGIAYFVVGSNIFTDPGTGFPVNLLTNGPGTATLTAGGILTIAGSNANTAVIYFPQLPVMGIEELRINPNSSPGTLAFDTKYSYNVSTFFPYPINDVSFYKNPAVDAVNLPGYIPKGTSTPVTWNGQDYQQFWTTNYQGALWATNGITVPFNISNIGMQFASAATVPALTGAIGLTPTTAQFTVVGNPLVVGDFVYANEFTANSGVNWQTGYVTTAGDTFIVTFPFATIVAGALGIGMIQYLTNSSNTSVDCIRWYDGDPTDGLIPPTFSSGLGWVNYMPPLSEGDYSIADLPPAIYYLAGCRMIVPFKDRLLFLGPVVQTKSGIPIYLQDTIIFSQNGTPYYTSSFTNAPSAVIETPTSITINFHPILVPVNQTATAPAMFEDQVGFGGFISAGVSDAINSVGSNEDALIVGFSKIQTRVLASGDDINAFEFFIVNSELGTSSVFSTIDMDQAVLSRGSRGYVMTNQTSCQRFDIAVIDQVFRVNLVNNGNERFTAQRDFINEWVYFTYNSNQSTWRYPNQTLLYNYRDNSFAIFNESYTTYGPFVESSGKQWNQLIDFTWENWNTPWNAGDNTIFQPIILGGNQQGFLMIRETKETEEDPSLTIQDLSGGIVTSPNHNLNNDDFILIEGVLGTIGASVNGKVFKVVMASANTFTLNPPTGAGTYLGGGVITRYYVPFVQTKQFPLAWDMSRKTRIGPQQYLLSKTDAGQITVQIYLSQDSSTPFNDGPIIPSNNVINSSLIYSQQVFTCPESTNLGLTPFNSNLNMLVTPGPTAGSPAVSGSAQIWHRMNTSLIGDTVQLGFTISHDQMSDPNLKIQTEEVELHGFTVEVSSAGLLA